MITTEKDNETGNADGDDLMKETGIKLTKKTGEVPGICYQATGPAGI